MRNVKIVILLALAVVMWLAAPASAARATRGEALTVAKNWVAMILSKEGHWGDSPTARVTTVQEFRRDKQLLGYFCPVEPKGDVVVCLHKQLAAVKAWSDTSDLDPTLDQGMADLIKGGIERMIKAVEKKTGKKIGAASDKEITGVLDIDYNPAWVELASGAPERRQETQSVLLQNYQQGGVLLTSVWHQGWPYNDQCPFLGCSNTTNGRALVGCVATAGAQIMRYWAFPPLYTWRDMPDDLTGTSPPAQIAETARLNSDVGVRVGMNYGCDESSSVTADMVGVFISYHYSSEGYDQTCHVEKRADYATADAWFGIVKEQLNVNRPMQYKVTEHSIVCDGWRIDGTTKEVHMNYGWNDPHTMWYTLDSLHLGDKDIEYIVTDIVPKYSIHGTMSGSYPRNALWDYRYFDRDATGESATFAAGQHLQFLPRVTATGTSATGGSVRIYGSDAINTYLYTRGDTTRGVVIRNSALKLMRNGGIVFY